MFRLITDLSPQGDQEKAIQQLVHDPKINFNSRSQQNFGSPNLPRNAKLFPPKHLK
ncbi:648_t:CDS:2, partial [Entrophospora sp. SA101]